VVLLGAMLVSNLPDDVVPEPVVDAEQAVTDVTGLSQSWALFAPTPRNTTVRLRAELDHADGTATTWIPPTGERVLGVYRSYRWRKWAGWTLSPDREALHRGLVHHLRAEVAARGDPPVTELRLYRGVARQPPPGSGEPIDRTPDYEEELLFTSSAPSLPDPRGGR
jgi:hypothetical protein